jgi:uncharacterized protein with FMN-binding domain
MRAPLVIAATAAAVAGIVTFHPHGPSNSVTFAAPTKHAVGGTTFNGGGALSGAPPASGPAPSTTTTTSPPVQSSPAPTTQPPTTTTTAPPATGPNGTASGNVTQYRYGVLQVTATVSGGRLTNISTQVQSSDGRSQQIDDSALPTLRDQALSAQSANIQGVSGATYTSQAFSSSLQSALSSLGFNG